MLDKVYLLDGQVLSYTKNAQDYVLGSIEPEIDFVGFRFKLHYFSYETCFEGSFLCGFQFDLEL